MISKGGTAFMNFAILLITSKVLGAEIRGEIAVFILNISIIQIITEIYSGYTLIHFIPKYSFKKLYNFGFIWIVIITSILSVVFYLFKIGMVNNWEHLFFLSFIIILHSFHLVFILGKEKIKLYNVLSISQPLLLVVSLLVCIFIMDQKSLDSYIVSMYISFIIPAIVSSFFILKTIKNPTKEEDFFPKKIITNGFYNQIAVLTHLLSNRYNFYLLAINSVVGVYAGATSLIESIWLISGSVAPIILTHVANSCQSEENKHITFVLSKLCFLLSCFCVLVLFFIPNDFFVYILGDDFYETKHIMLLLSPGIVCVSFSTIIVHYFSGIGNQRIIAIANVSGLILTISFGYLFVSRFGVIGACCITTLSYFTTSIILLAVFMKKSNFSILDLFELRRNLHLIKKNK